MKEAVGGALSNQCILHSDNASFCTLEILYHSFCVLYLLISVTYYLITWDVSYSSVHDLFLLLLSAE